MAWSLVVLAPLSLLASDLPRALAWPCALLALLLAGFDANRYRLQSPRILVIPAGRGVPQCDGVEIKGLQVAWRGPLAFLRWREAGGAVQRASLWPDTLDAATRRELRLALMRMQAARDGASMAG